MNQSHRLFHEWHQILNGPLDWESFRQRMTDLREEVRPTLEEGLWTFARIQGIEPPNNAAERALGFGVIWRRISD